MTKILTQIRNKDKMRTMSVLTIAAIMTISLMTSNLSMNAYANHGPVDDLSDGWTVENYPVPIGAGHPNGVWTVAGNTETVAQTANSVPTVFINDFDIGTMVITASVTGAGEDDFFGFVLGYNPGELGDDNADYLLIDWKRNSQTISGATFSGACVGAVPTADAGLALSRVSGIPDPDEFWSHSDLGCGASTGSVDELARATNLGATGWTIGTTYTFDIILQPDRIQVFVDGVLEFEVEDDFSGLDGRFGFYDFSQNQAVFGEVTFHYGCSLGFWKTDTKSKFGEGEWPIPSGTLLESIFDNFDPLKGKGSNKNIADPTFLEALTTTGGGHNALAREAAAAYLNAIDPDVDYFLTDTEVVDLVNAALAGDEDDIEDARAFLKSLNKSGCPLSHTLV